jgi:hypothetical protein
VNEQRNFLAKSLELSSFRANCDVALGHGRDGIHDFITGEMQRLSDIPSFWPYYMWYSAVARYSECGLTMMPEDKLVAISAIAKHIASMIPYGEYAADLYGLTVHSL